MMHRTLRGAGLALTVLLALSITERAQAQPREAQARAMARRGALVDAYRQLLEQVKGLQVDSQTYVRDFVTESDVIAADVDEFIKGGRIVDTRFYDDGTAEVDVEITVEDLEEELHRIVRERWTLHGWKRQAPEIRIHRYYTRRTIVATGSSVVASPDAQAAEEPDAAPPAPDPYHPRPRGAAHPDWSGVPAQQKLMAKRGAQLDAYRQLLERVKGLRLTSTTYVRDFVTESDVISTELNDFLRGARVVDTRYVAGPICEVEVEVNVEDFEQEFERIVQRHGRHEDVILRVHDHYDENVLSAMGMAVPGGGPVARHPAAAPARPAWADQLILATGSGIAPPDAESPEQARLLAERAAEIDAKRQLLERIGGVFIDGTTAVRDLMTTSDAIRAEVDGVVADARRVDTRYNADGLVEVDVEAPLDGVWRAISEHR